MYAKCMKICILSIALRSIFCYLDVSYFVVYGLDTSSIMRRCPAQLQLRKSEVSCEHFPNYSHRRGAE